MTNLTTSGDSLRPARMRAAELVRNIAIDAAYGLFWAALVVAIVLFSGAVSQFAYVDF